MAQKLEWKSVPTGETITARLERGVESVYVGERLVSRSPPAGKPEGHTVTVAGQEAHVAFARATNACTCLLAGAPLEPLAAPVAIEVIPTAPASDDEAPQRRKRVVLGVAGGVLALLVVGMATRTMGLHRPGDYVDRMLGSNTPFNASHRSPDGSISASYPTDFSPKSGSFGELMIGRDGVEGERVYFTSVLAGDQSAATASAAFLADFGKSVQDQGITVVPGGAKPSTCFEHDEGTEAVATIRKGDRAATLWACTFLRWGMAYTLAYAVPEEREYGDELLLRRIVASTKITHPLVPFFGAPTSAFGGH
jgi:hypothetical protein